MLDKVDGNRIGNDLNKYLIALCQEMQKDNFELPTVDEKMFLDMKNNLNNYPDWQLGYAGFQLSFGSMWFGSYRKDKIGIRNYENEASRNVNSQRKNLLGVKFFNKNYWELEIPDKSIIYCDPPYAGTTEYSTGSFNHENFWNWCERMVLLGHKVFVSEYNAPKDWICIWSKEVTTALAVKTYKKDIEKLFVHKSQLSKI